MPSWSWYNLEVSLGALLVALDVVLLDSVRKAGIEVKNTSIKEIKPTMAEGFREGSIKDKEMIRGRRSGEDELLCGEMLHRMQRQCQPLVIIISALEVSESERRAPTF